MRLTRLCIFCLSCSIYFSSWAADENLTLLIYGDSLSASYGIEQEQGWVNLLKSKLLSEEWPVDVVNGSVSGETTTGGLARLPAMLDSYQPELLILELGGNDGLRGLPLDLMRENLASMIDLAKANGAEVILTGIQIPPNYGPRYTVPFFETYSALAEEKSLSLVPFLIDGIPQQPELMQNDGIHPRAQAQSMILDNVWPILKPQLESLLTK
ncbi:MAG: acyl-CoA thioesterase-1 [Pseudohongiellaceae bacterium]|jgi:acyl-CoA thioesterase-1|nr:arylesterase [Pseudomonadota bacterium]